MPGKCIVCGGNLRGRQRKYCCDECKKIGVSTAYHAKRLDRLLKRLKTVKNGW